MAMKSRVNREVHARICEGLGVKFPGLLDRQELRNSPPEARSEPGGFIAN
jgi:hypothetical protein